MRAADDVSAALRDLRAERAQRVEVQVHRPRAELAPARHGQARRSEAREDRAEKNDRGAQLPHEIVRDEVAVHAAGINAHRVPVALRRAAEMAQDAQRDRHVLQVGHVVQNRLTAGEHGCRHNRQHRILGALHLGAPGQSVSAVNVPYAHNLSSA